MTLDTKNALLVCPRFGDDKFMFHYDALCQIFGAKQSVPPLGLMTVAAMLPKSWNVRLIDCNIYELSDSDLLWADLVMSGGMISQQQDTLRIIDRCHGLGRPIAVGGPDVTATPHLYEAADYRVVGEAEDVIEAFIDAWLGGQKRGVFEPKKFSVDMTRSPLPRFDLINNDDYLQVGVQISRGCPFTCEFCDVIEIYGRVPRTKSHEQIFAELNAIYDSKYRGLVYFVDDNLIGNKKFLRSFLAELKKWQEERHFPFQFHAAASINLADDAALLADLNAANFVLVFIGIETGDTEALVQLKKKQNARRDIGKSVRTIQNAGLLVAAGFIVGLDDEGDDLVDPMVSLINEGPIAICLVSLLYALPNTQLTRRLQLEGRLGDASSLEFPDLKSGSCIAGLNFVTRRPKEKILSDFASLLLRLYDRKSYFERVTRAAAMLKMNSAWGSQNTRAILQDVRRFSRFIKNIHFRHSDLIVPFWRAFGKVLWHNPRAFKSILMMTAMYPHLRTFTGRAVREVELERARLLRQFSGKAAVSFNPPSREQATG